MTRSRDIANLGDGITTADIGDGQVTAGKLNSTLDLTGKTVTLPSGVGGKVLQVVQDTATATFTQPSATYAGNGLSATITPASTSNKILILVSGAMYQSSSSQHSIATVFRGGVSSGTDLSPVGGGHGMADCYSGASGVIVNVSISFVDSPTTDVAVTYEVATKVTNGSAIFPVNNGLCSITLLEISG